MSALSLSNDLELRVMGALDAPISAGQHPPVDAVQRRSDWEAQYVRRTRCADAAASFTAVGLAYLVRFGETQAGTGPVVYAWAAAAVPLLWLVCMTLSRG